MTASIGYIDAVMAGFAEPPDMARTALHPHYDSQQTLEAMPNTAFLSDLEEMLMPDFGSGYGTYLGYPSQTFRTS